MNSFFSEDDNSLSNYFSSNKKSMNYDYDDKYKKKSKINNKVIHDLEMI